MVLLVVEVCEVVVVWEGTSLGFLVAEVDPLDPTAAVAAMSWRSLRRAAGTHYSSRA